MTKCLLSYPRSGNHLVRFFIELLSEIPTIGCMDNKKDIMICMNTFTEVIPFNISQYNIDSCYYKYHHIPNNINIDSLIIIIRNPNEVLLRYHNNIPIYDNNPNSCKDYFDILDYYINFTGKKICFFYEDIITDKIQFINNLYNFLELDNESKKTYVLENLEKLYILSSTGTNRSWEGICSNSCNFYYSKIPIDIKPVFDNYINTKMKNIKYLFIKNKYNL